MFLLLNQLARRKIVFCPRERQESRKYDGTVEIDGLWYGIETKGGSASRSPQQAAFDAWLNTPGNTVMTPDGRTLVGVFDVWIDR